MAVKFDSFEMGETFACSLQKLFAAFTNPVTKRAWYVDGAHADTHDTWRTRSIRKSAAGRFFAWC